MFSFKSRRMDSVKCQAFSRVATVTKLEGQMSATSIFTPQAGDNPDRDDSDDHNDN